MRAARQRRNSPGSLGGAFDTATILREFVNRLGSSMKFCYLAVRTYCSCLLSAIFLFTLATIAFSQGVTGVISGTVTDPSKAPIGSAAITITNSDTGVTAYARAKRTTVAFTALPTCRSGVMT